VPRQLAAGQTIRIPGKVALAPEEPARPAPSPRAATPRPTEATRPEPTQVVAPPQPVPAEPDAATTRALIEQHYRNGQAAYSRQDLNTAIREWDKVLELDPGNELAKARREQAVALQKRLKELGK